MPLGARLGTKAKSRPLSLHLFQLVLDDDLDLSRGHAQAMFDSLESRATLLGPILR